MRKIIIDDNIRNFASEYSSKVQAKCPNVITDLKKLRDNVISFNPQIDQSIVKNYINEIVLDYPNLIKMEPKDWNFKKYEKILQKNPDILSQKVNYDIKKKNAAGKPIEYYEEVLYKRIMFCLRYDETRIILGEIHQKIKLKACIYCNTQPTRSAEGEVFYEMDHLKAKSLYPFLGTCFYNLQPSDSSCNKRKSTKPCDFQLYTNNPKEELSPFKFLPQITEIAPEKKQECINIKFVTKNGIETDASKQYKTTFHLDNLYAAYKDKVNDLYEKNRKMSEGMISAYKAGLNYEPTRAELTEFLLDCPYDEARIHEDVLRKLKVDTMEQLDSAGLLIK